MSISWDLLSDCSVFFANGAQNGLMEFLLQVWVGQVLDIVDGRNPANQLRLVVSLSHHLKGFCATRVPVY